MFVTVLTEADQHGAQRLLTLEVSRAFFVQICDLSAHVKRFPYTVVIPDVDCAVLREYVPLEGLDPSREGSLIVTRECPFKDGRSTYPCSMHFYSGGVLVNQCCTLASICFTELLRAWKDAEGGKE